MGWREFFWYEQARGGCSRRCDRRRDGAARLGEPRFYLTGYQPDAGGGWIGVQQGRGRNETRVYDENPLSFHASNMRTLGFRGTGSSQPWEARSCSPLPYYP